MNNNVIKQLCAEVKLPKMLKARQLFDRERIEPDKIPEAVFAEMSRPELGDYIKPGKRIAITSGSRGVANVGIITKAIADFVKSKGAVPFVVPAMGSHGGATAEGQRALIESYGVTEEFTGCPILSSMETVVIGKNDEGQDVRIDKNAAQADGIIVAGRIKPHTDFHGTYESGLMKMMAIGLGKREGADVCHELGFGHMAHRVQLFGRAVAKHGPVLLGFGIMENAYCETCKFVGLKPHEIESEEPKLLKEAREHLPILYFKNTDVLVVDRIGKDISGTGMDPNVTGTGYCTPFVTESCISVLRTVVLDLTEDTHGNAFGIGAAHATTKRLFDKLDFDATYINAVTSRGLDQVKIPCVMDTDKEAIQLALRTCLGSDRENPRVIRVQDSLHTETIWISQAMLPEAKANKRIEVLGEPEEWPFDLNGNLW
ncbi:MAG: nickel-dependent lactate racemase [Treponema sp.]|nr:nickel-dependent lactate racemase [Treponema sp.]